MLSPVFLHPFCLGTSWPRKSWAEIFSPAGLVLLSCPIAVEDIETPQFGGQLQRCLRKHCTETAAETGWMGQDSELSTEKKMEKLF